MGTPGLTPRHSGSFQQTAAPRVAAGGAAWSAVYAARVQSAASHTSWHHHAVTGAETSTELAKRRQALARSSRHLHGHGYQSPAQELERVAAWCQAEALETDVYGEGEFLQSFERRVAKLLGFAAARLIPSGTMAQPIALRLWAERRGTNRVGMHPTSHLELHEQGTRSRPFLSTPSACR